MNEDTEYQRTFAVARDVGEWSPEAAPCWKGRSQAHMPADPRGEFLPSVASSMRAPRVRCSTGSRKPSASIS